MKNDVEFRINLFKGTLINPNSPLSLDSSNQLYDTCTSINSNLVNNVVSVRYADACIVILLTFKINYNVRHFTLLRNFYLIENMRGRKSFQLVKKKVYGIWKLKTSEMPLQSIQHGNLYFLFSQLIRGSIHFECVLLDAWHWNIRTGNMSW